MTTLLSISKEVTTAAPEPSPRVLETAAMFGLGIDDQRTISIVPQCEIPLPTPGIIFITGPSGGGKSSILSLIHNKLRAMNHCVIQFNDLSEPSDVPIIDAIGSTLKDATMLLSICGLGDAFVMLRRPGELSDGQRYRFNLARTIELAQSQNEACVIIADELGATLDRLTAQTISRNIRRWISRTNHTFIAATTQDDLVDSLQPEVLIRKGLDEHIEVIQCDRYHASNDAYRIEIGTLDDYKQLSSFHYKGTRPGAVTTVFRLIDQNNTLVGVLVRSLPALSCRLRDVATHGRYSKLKPCERAILLNREVRTISRVVIDPRFRGLGLAVKLVRHALDHPEDGTVYTEALAAMGRVSPFFERAGMTRYDRPPHASEARLIDALAHLGIKPENLASETRTHEHISGFGASDLKFLERELRHWRRSAHETSSDETIDDLLRIARKTLFTQPVYYIYHHAHHST